MADSYGLSAKDPPTNWENKSFIPEGGQTWVGHHSVCHNHPVSTTDKGTKFLTT